MMDVQPERALEGRVVVVTGASSGMGKGITVGMAAAGASVTLVGRDSRRLEEVAESISGTAGDHRVIQTDLDRDDAAAKVVAATLGELGRLDCVVHCAGIFLVAPPEDSLELLDRQWVTNVRAPYRLTVAALPSLRESSGSVVFFSSIAGKVGFPSASAYCATKGAIELMTKSLAVEEAPNGVRVNAIAPGNVETPMNAHLMADPEYKQAMLDATPLGRNGHPRDVVPMVLLLASSAGSWITGQSIVIDGGWVAR